MSAPEITPELLRSVADWIDGMGHGLEPGQALRASADELQQMQADAEKRLDEYVQVYMEALVDYNSLPVSAPTPALRAGLRAVLAHRDKERRPDVQVDRHGDPTHDPFTAGPAFDKGGWPIGTMYVSRDTVYGRPTTIDHIAGVINGNTYGDPGADPASEWDQQDSPAGTIPTLCAQSDSTVGYLCTRLHGHTGQHQAKLEGTILGTWGGAA